MDKKLVTLLLSVIMVFIFSFGAMGNVSDNLAVKKVSLGENFSAVLLNNGTLWVWGNLFEEGISSKPVKIDGIDNISEISCGLNHCAILKKDGTVWVIGQTYWLDVKSGNILKPVKIDGFSDIQKIDSGRNYILGLKSDGTVMSVGENDFGQLGVGTTDIATSPVDVKDLKNIKSISAGYDHSLAVDLDGNVWSWGNNENGQLSRGPLGGVYKVAGISAGLKNVKDVKAGNGFSLFLKSDGSVYSSGLNDKGQLGFETDKNIGLAQKISDLSNIVMIDVGAAHSIAMKRDTCVYSWGLNNKGQLGGNYIDSNKPTKMDIKGAVAVYANGDNTAVLKADKKLWIIGDNSYGQFCDGSILESYYGKNIGLKDIVKVSTGIGHSFSIDKNGNLFGWGLNQYGQIDSSGTEIITSPKSISFIKNVNTVDGGELHTIALKNDGSVYTWGNNVYYQLSVENFESKDIPIKVNGLNNIKKIKAGSYHNLALDANGKVYAWGKNSFAQLGNGDYADLYKPTLIDGLSNIVDIGAGDNFSVALDGNGNIYSWGSNQYGQLGNDLTSSNVPVKLTGLENIVSISTGKYNVLAIDKNGDVWAWGKNEDGELGLADKSNIFKPSKINTLKNVKSSSCGEGFSIFVNSNGEISSMGNFILKEKITNVKSVQCGADFIVVNKNDGSVYTAGKNNFGQLGIKSINMSEKPVLSSIYKKNNSGIIVSVNANILDFDVEPMIKNGRTLVPLRGIFEFLKVDVSWDGTTKTVTCKKGEKTVVVKIDSNVAIVDGKDVKLDTAPIIKNGRTLIPLRFISESLGASVDWDQESRTAIVVEK